MWLGLSRQGTPYLSSTRRGDRPRACSLPGFFLFLTVLTAPLAAAPPPVGVERLENPEAAFRFDTLDYPNVRGAPFVRIATGRSMQRYGEPPKNRYRHGFLLEDTAVSFRAFVIETLEMESFERTTMVAEDLRVGFDETDLKSYIDEKTRRYFRGDPFDPDGNRPDEGKDKISDRAKLFAIAWAASRNGLSADAARLFNVAARIPHKAHSGPLQSARERIAVDVAHAEMWRAVEQFGDISISRTDLLDRFRWLAASFPESPHHERARQTAALLAQMADEDEERAGRSVDWALRDLPIKEQVAEWIYRLRDQNGKQYYFPLECDVFSSHEGVEDSPAHVLVRFGYDAVPQLIEALDDQRLTRSIERDDEESFSHRILTIGRAAEAILTKIAGRRFDLPLDGGRRTSDADCAAAKKKLVRAWYDDFRRTGEAATWAAGVLRGDSNAVEQATRLVERYPTDAAQSIVAGARQACDPVVRGELVTLLAGLEGDGILPFLQEEAASTHLHAAYVEAGMVLARRGHPMGVAALLDRWRQAAEISDKCNVPEVDRSEANGIDKLAHYLVRLNDAASVRDVAARMHRFPFRVRMTIVEACDRDAFPVRAADGETAGPTPEFEEARLALLILALEDDRDRPERFPQLWQKCGETPRICDFAGQALFERDPNRYPFNLAADMMKRDQARYAMIAGWRKGHDLPPLPERKPKPPTAVAAD